jgi:hypothetical protein
MSDPSRAAAAPARRPVLIGGALVGLGALAGVGAGVIRRSSSDGAAAPPRPDVLLAAVRAERDLLVQLSAAAGTRSAPAAVLHQLRADHLAHLAALTAAVSIATGAAASTASSPPPSSSPAADRAHLRAAENAAAAAAAQRALLLTGRDAVLLASIAACESSHAELLG